jgi:hypothetical protein
MKRYSPLLLGLALILSACATVPQAETSGLTFVHLNDTYRVGAVEDGKAGGFSRVVTLVRELQDEGRDVRILQSTPSISWTRSRRCSWSPETMNSIGAVLIS